MTRINLPQVKDYDDYRKYLSDFLDFKKDTDKTFSLRELARKAGISASGHITRVIRGEVNLSREYAIKYLDALQISGPDHLDFFTLLEGAPDELYKKSAVDISGNEILFVKTYIGALVLYRDDFKANENWIHDAFSGAIPIAVIRTALSSMIEDRVLTLEGDKWKCELPRNTWAGLADDMLGAVTNLDLPILGFNVITTSLTDEQANRLSNELSTYVYSKVNEYEKENAEKGTGGQTTNLMTAGVFVKQLTKFK